MRKSEAGVLAPRSASAASEVVELVPMSTPAQNLFIGGDLSAEKLIEGEASERGRERLGHLEVTVPEYDDLFRLITMGLAMMLHLAAVLGMVLATDSRIALVAFALTSGTLAFMSIRDGVRRTSAHRRE